MRKKKQAISREVESKLINISDEITRGPTSSDANGSMAKNLAVHSSKLSPKQLKKAQVSTSGRGPNHTMVTP